MPQWSGKLIASMLAPSFLMWLVSSFHLVPARRMMPSVPSSLLSSAANTGTTAVAATVFPSSAKRRRPFRALPENKEDEEGDKDGKIVSGGGDDETRKKNNASSRRFPTVSVSDRSVIAILAAAFLNLLGFTMAGPITPALGRHFNLKVGASFGSLTSAYPLGMLFGLALWPQLSDRIGRKPVMALSLLGSGMGLAVQSHAVRSGWSLQAFLLARVLTGSFSGSSPVSKAYLADVGAPTGRLPRYLAWRDAASTLSFIVGPVLGGIFYEARRMALKGASAVEEAAAAATDTTGSLSFVIAVSSIASLAASALVSLAVADIPKAKAPTSSSSSSSLKDEKNAEGQEEIVSCPLGVRLWAGVATVCVVSFLFNVGDSTFHAFFPALMQQNLGLSTKSIGLAFTSFAFISFGVSASFSASVVRRFGPVAACASGLSATGIGLLTLALSSSFEGTAAQLLALGAAALYYTGVPLYGPSVPTMLLRCVPSHRRGAVMGLDGAINTMARVISPLFMGEIYRRGGPVMAFGAAGSAAFVGAVLAVLRRVLVIRNQGKLNIGDGAILKE